MRGVTVVHFGHDNTIFLVEDRFYLPSVKQDVARIGSHCRGCRIKHWIVHPFAHTLCILGASSYEFYVRSSHTMRKHDSVLVAVDGFSKMLHFIPYSMLHTLHICSCERLFAFMIYLGLLFLIRDVRFTSHFWSTL